MIGMINAFKKWRTKAETTGWGVNPLDHDRPVNDELPDNGTICQLLVLKCPWYYDFEDLFHDHPNVTAPYMIESGGPDREAGCEVPPDREDDEEGVDLEGESIGFENVEIDSPVSWAASDQGKKADYVFIILIINKLLDERLTRELREGQKELGDDLEEMARVGIVQLKASTILPSRPALSTQHRTIEPVGHPRGSKTPQPIPSRRKPSATSSRRSESKRPRPATINLGDSESENEGSRASNKRKKKAYGNQGFLSVGEAMVSVEHIRDEGRLRAED